MNESEFLKAIEADPCDPTPRLIYADWLDEQGDARGELMRIQEELRHIDVDRRDMKEARMHKLLKEGFEPLTITRTNSIGMEMVLIFPGEFLMGSPANDMDRLKDEDQVAVKLTQPYYLGRFVVTQAEWFRVMDTNLWSGEEKVNEGDQFPATYVSWGDAVAWCEMLSEQLSEEGLYTIPTEAQWEYACRAGTTTRFSFGNNESRLSSYAWFDPVGSGSSHEGAHEVGQKCPNPWGLYDIHGNVDEWCRDWWDLKLPGGHDPEASEETSIPFRVARGGCWPSTSVFCRSACRTFNMDGDWSQGFRVAFQLRPASRVTCEQRFT